MWNFCGWNDAMMCMEGEEGGDQVHVGTDHAKRNGTGDFTDFNSENGALGAKIIVMASNLWISMLCYRDDERH